jgi:DNA topoisomerase-2
MLTFCQAHWLSVLHTEYRKLRNQARFVKEIIDGDLTVGKKKKTVLVAELRQRKYEAFPPAATKKNDDNDDEGGAAEEDDLEEEGGSARDFDYLLGMPIWSLTAERLDKLNDSIAKKKQEHDELETLDEKDLWCRDLDAFLEAWEHQVEERSKTEKGLRNMGRRASKKIGAGPSKRGKNAAKGDDEYSPVKPKAAPRAKAEPKKVETKTHERFAEKFGALKPPRPKKEDSDGDDDAFGDEDFGALSKPKKAAAKKDSGGAPKQESDEEMVDVPAAPVR